MQNAKAMVKWFDATASREERNTLMSRDAAPAKKQERLRIVNDLVVLVKARLAEHVEAHGDKAPKLRVPESTLPVSVVYERTVKAKRPVDVTEFAQWREDYKRRRMGAHG